MFTNAIVHLHSSATAGSKFRNICTGLYRPFHYSGNSTAATSVVSLNSNQNYAVNTYGNKNQLSFGIGIRTQYIYKSGFIIGLQAGYDVLKSNVDITSVYFPLLAQGGNPGNSIESTSGQTSLKNQFINISPYIGYRIAAKTINIDLMPGVDFGFNIKSAEQGSYMITGGNGAAYQTNDKQNIPTDVRIKFAVAAIYRRFSITAGFARGLTNYITTPAQFSYPSPPQKIYSELFLFGIGYRIN